MTIHCKALVHRVASAHLEKTGNTRNDGRSKSLEYLKERIASAWLERGKTVVEDVDPREVKALVKQGEAFFGRGTIKVERRDADIWVTVNAKKSWKDPVHGIKTRVRRVKGKNFKQVQKRLKKFIDMIADLDKTAAARMSETEKDERVLEEADGGAETGITGYELGKYLGESTAKANRRAQRLVKEHRLLESEWLRKNGEWTERTELERKGIRVPAASIVYIHPNHKSAYKKYRNR